MAVQIGEIFLKKRLFCSWRKINIDLAVHRVEYQGARPLQKLALEVKVREILINSLRLQLDRLLHNLHVELQLPTLRLHRVRVHQSRLGLSLPAVRRDPVVREQSVWSLLMQLSVHFDFDPCVSQRMHETLVFMDCLLRCLLDGHLGFVHELVVFGSFGVREEIGWFYG